jgi:hypothetical protein
MSPRRAPRESLSGLAFIAGRHLGARALSLHRTADSPVRSQECTVTRGPPTTPVAAAFRGAATRHGPFCRPF